MQQPKAPLLGKTQEDLVIEHLMEIRSITGVEAATLYKIRSLPRRIATLRNQGWIIKSVRCVDHTGQRYVRYRLEG